MNPRPEIQPLFLEKIKALLPEHISFPDELAHVLNVSRDSAYRRIRGETLLSLEEVRTICQHYKVSLDLLLAPNTNTISFHHRVINNTSFTFHHWLKSVLQNLEMISQFPQRELVYCAKDIPLFHYFHLPTLAAFKIYFWIKVYNQHPDYKQLTFSDKAVPSELLATAEKVTRLYWDIPSVEIWSEEVANITLRQIEYSIESGFISKAISAQLRDEYLQLLETLKSYAANGSKNGRDQNYVLYKNDILIADTTLLFKMGEKRVTYLTYNTMNILTTSEENFCSTTEAYLNNLVHKSTLISLSGEKDRNKFFNGMLKRIKGD